MKNSKLKFSALSAASAVALTMFLASPPRAEAGGTDILHLTSVTFMTNNNVERRADGVVIATQKEQGRANNQTLSVAVSGLTASNTYELVALFDTDTNIVDAGPFTTDGRGRAMLDFTSLGNGHGGGRHSIALPDSLNPVSLVRELDVVDTNLQVVLSANLTSPDRLQYLVKRNLSAGKVKALLFIQANQKKTQFQLLASGLVPNSDYRLVLDDADVVLSNSSDRKGRLNIRGVTDTPPQILEARSATLLDDSSNVVLQAELP